MAKDETEEVNEESKDSNVYGVPIQYIVVAAILITLAVWAIFPLLETVVLFGATIFASACLLFVLSFLDFEAFEKSKNNILPLVFSIIVIVLLASGASILLTVLFSTYLIAFILLAGKNIKPQTAILIMLAITAVCFRVYPAMDCGNPSKCPMPGHLISMDDPYYHYKQTERLYTLGDVPDRDFTIYPPEGKTTPNNFPYYFNTYMAFLTGNPIHDTTILYPVLISILGTIMAFLFIKELLGDWKSGLIGGLLFATMPVILSKSVAGAIEEDFMGMAIAMFAFYLLIKALKSTGRTNLKFTLLAGFGFFLTLATWKGIEYLYAAPFGAIAIYLGIVLVLNILTYLFKRPGLQKNTWDIAKTTMIVGIIPLVGNFLFFNSNSLPAYLTLPFGAVVLAGFLSELLNVFVFGAEDKKSEVEKRFFLPVAILILLVLLAGLAFIGIDRILEMPQTAFETFSGAGSKNFLVDKTISEQSALSKGDLVKKLSTGFKNYYSIGEILTIIMLFLLPLYLVLKYSRDLMKSLMFLVPLLLIMVYALISNFVIGVVVFAALSCMPVIYFSKKDDLEKVSWLSLAYTVAVMFFGIAMYFVWTEARLAFSQALGFIFLGAAAGLLLPKNFKEVGTLKIIPLILILVILPMTIFYPGILNTPTSWESSQRAAGISPAWFLGVKWLEENTQAGSYVGTTYTGGDYVLTWWDYGHFITALSGDTVITDPLHTREDYIMETARFFYNATDEDAAIKWLTKQPWNTKDENGKYKLKYIILDDSLVSKASALAFLGTNYYQVPNDLTAIDGICSDGEICQNVELIVGGKTLMAEKTEDGYVCSQGVVCKGDSLAGLDPRRCCEAEPTQCCTTSYDWHVVDNEGGSAKLLRSPGEPVYTQYTIDTGQYRSAAGGNPCGSQYRTSYEPFFLVENGQQKRVLKSYLYRDIFILRGGISGLPYDDGNYYPFLTIFQYEDGTEDIKFLSANCDEVGINELLASGNDLVVPMDDGIKLSNGDIMSRTLLHAPKKWLNNMFTELYLKNAEDLDNFKLIRDNKTKRIYPIVKIYKINYPDESSDVGDIEPPIEPESSTGASKGDVVEVDYTGRFENGTVFDTSASRGPLEFTLGSGKVISGFDSAVTGMQIGESKTVTIPPKEAYGVEGTHALAGKTLVFDITLVTINGQGLLDEPKEEPASVPTDDAVSTSANESTTTSTDNPVDTTADTEALNLTFDYYSSDLIESYNIKKVPTVIWNCQYFKKGSASEELSELETLKIMTCAITKAQPEELCSDVGILLDEKGEPVYTDSTVATALTSLKRVAGESSCAAQNTTMIQVFYGNDCVACASQQKDLTQLKEEFGDLIDISYFCVGDESYCKENAEETI